MSYWIAGTALIVTVPATITFKAVLRFFGAGRLIGYLSSSKDPTHADAADGSVDSDLPSNTIDPRSLL
jgi:hypothetical protein